MNGPERGLSGKEFKEIQGYTGVRVRGNALAERATHEHFVTRGMRPKGFVEGLRVVLSKLTGGAKPNPRAEDAGNRRDQPFEPGNIVRLPKAS